MKLRVIRTEVLLLIACAVCSSNIGCTGFSFSSKAGSGTPPSATYTIEGTLTPNADGSYASVTLSGATTATTFADNFGNYNFGGLAPGSYTVTPIKSGFTFHPTSQSATVGTANVTGLDFAAAKAGATTFTLAGTISPAAAGSGATVTLSGTATSTITADGGGNYAFSGLVPGDYTVTVSKSGYSFSPASQNETISISSVTGVNFTATQLTYTLTGTISPAAGGSGATVTLSGSANATATADSNGNYVFSGLPSGNYAVTPSKSGYSFSPASQNETISSSSVTGVNFTATQLTYTLTGTISPAAAGSGATVALGGSAHATATADSRGNFAFSGLFNGNYTVTPNNSGYSFTPVKQNVIVNSSNVTGVNFTGSSTTPLTFSLSGTISPSAAGSGATVTLSGAANATTTADSGGNYTFNGLASGDYTVAPTKDGYRFTPASQNETISGSSVTGANFTGSSTSLPQFSISGTITPAAGGSGTTIKLSGSANATATADSGGNYTFTGLATGSYTVTPSKNGYSFTPTQQNANITSSSLTGINFTDSQSVENVVNINPGDDIPSIVSASPPGTTFIIYPGTYRLTQPIIPKDNDSFTGQTSCAPPASSCPAIISGATVIGPSATFNGSQYVVKNQTQHNLAGTNTTNCDPGWLACIYPEDLYFDGVPLQHLYSPSLPAMGSGQWWFDYTNHIIYFHDNPAGHTVETSVIPFAFGGAANNVTIQFLTVQEFASMYPNAAVGVSQGANAQTQGINWIVQYCEVRLNHGNGIRVGYQIQILNNYSHDNGQLGVGGGLGVVSAPLTESINSGIVIQGNVIRHNDYAHFNPQFGSGGIKIGATSGVTIRGNTIQDNVGSGVHFDDNSESELVDGNTIINNSDADGLQMEIGYGTSTFRNNVVSGNGAQVRGSNSSSQISVRASAGVNAYCNVMEMASGPGINQWIIGAADRGNSAYPPHQYLATTGNSFHHNTVIWDTGAGGGGGVGFLQGDASNQPNFFANNTPPDYNTYHLPSISTANFVFDNNDSESDLPLTFAEYQANGADTHGTADTNYTSGFPTVAITSPADQSSSAAPVAIAATATDPSGISKVEFYLDWALQSSVVSAPYNATISSSAPGSHVIAAMAYSNAGIRSCSAITWNQQ